MHAGRALGWWSRGSWTQKTATGWARRETPMRALSSSCARVAPRDLDHSHARCHCISVLIQNDALAGAGGAARELRVEIDPASGLAPYEQIRAQVVAHVATGRLRVGDRLPTIRALATELGLAPGTVARAYRELEAAGVVTTRRRAGTVVSDGASPADVVAREAAGHLVRTAREAGLTDDAILDVVRGALLHEPSPGRRDARATQRRPNDPDASPVSG